MMLPVMVMPRQRRKKSESGIYHIMLRGINHNIIFYDDQDRQYFIRSMKKASEKTECDIYSYCLMDNHIHILVKDNVGDLEGFVKSLGSGYVLWYNDKYARVGHLFQDRFKSEAVERDQYLLSVSRYIHRNPVKAGLAKNVGEYKWSSYSAYYNNTTWVKTEPILDYFGNNPQTARKNFKIFVNNDDTEQCLDIDKCTKMTDSELIHYIHNELRINVSKLTRLEVQRRNNIIRLIRYKTGASIRQLSRVLDISKKIVETSLKKTC